MADLDESKVREGVDEALSKGSALQGDSLEQLQAQGKEPEKAAPKLQAFPAGREALDLSLLMDVSLQVTVELGRTRMTVESLLRLSQGSVVELNRIAGEPLDIYINNKLMARGEAVVIKEKFGVRVTDVLSPDKRLEGLG